ncbi:MAG: cobalamin B12-binding domain-containing protein [Coprothermobacterota bacterium]|jgi:methylmalonyl-CoA mutase C-terminal domain/subunit|nr:cobalamin B12-binding domain-containing protein [Coprothermobacterota bacterium]
MDKQKIRILIAKVGLDGHDRGAKYISQALRDRGYEVIYTGIRQTTDDVAKAAVQEDVKFVGLSLLSGAHNQLFPKVVEKLRELGAADIVVFGGGVIPADDIPFLLEHGIRAVFTPGTTTDQMEEFIRTVMEESA